MSSFTEDLIVRVSSDKVHGRTIYIIHAPFEYRVGSFENPDFIVSVPVGFRTDFMSIPSFLRPIFDAGYGAKAAVVHDYLLSQGFPPKQADRVFREALGVLGMGLIQRNLYYRAVRLSSQLKQLFQVPVYY